MTNINFNKLKQDRKKLNERICALKAELRTTWTGPMWRQQSELLDLKAKATGLNILRAWLRGKVHLAPNTKNINFDGLSVEDYCEKVAQRHLVDYQLEEEEAA